jgi:hypothetical protein
MWRKEMSEERQLIAIPSTIYEKYKNYTVVVAVLPTITKGEIIDKLRNSMSITVCDYPECYPLLFGGIFVFLDNKILTRYEFDGYVRIDQKKYEEFNINDFIKEKCYTFEKETLCFTKSKCDDCIPIDNVGLRFIV